MPYFARKVKRICDIRGCRNTDCYAISKSREAGKSIIICTECLKGGLAAVEELEKNAPVPKTSGNSEPPALFFPEALKKEEPKKTDNDGKEKTEPPEKKKASAKSGKANK